MGRQLFQTEGDTFLFVIEIEDNHIDFLVELNDFFGMINASPTQVGDMDKSVYAAKVDEYAIAGDVFNHAFEYLTFFKFANDFFFLLFEFCFDKNFVRNNNVFEFLVDFYDFEFHGFAYEYIVVADRFHVYLRTRQESFNAEYVHNHTAFGATFYETLDNFIVVECFVNTFPRACGASLFVRQDELSFFVFLVFNKHFYCVAYFQIRIVAEFAHRDDAVRFETDVYDNFAFVHRDDGTVHHFFVFDLTQCFFVQVG